MLIAWLCVDGSANCGCPDVASGRRLSKVNRNNGSQNAAQTHKCAAIASPIAWQPNWGSRTKAYSYVIAAPFAEFASSFKSGGAVDEFTAGAGCCPLRLLRTPHSAVWRPCSCSRPCPRRLHTKDWAPVGFAFLPAMVAPKSSNAPGPSVPQRKIDQATVTGSLAPDGPRTIQVSAHAHPTPRG